MTKQQAVKMTMPKFIAWLEKQPARKRYSYISNDNCLIAQFLKSQGVKEPHVLGFTFATSRFGRDQPVPKNIYKAAVGDPETFGSALKRANALSR